MGKSWWERCPWFWALVVRTPILGPRVKAWAYRDTWHRKWCSPEALANYDAMWEKVLR